GRSTLGLDGRGCPGEAGQGHRGSRTSLPPIEEAERGRSGPGRLWGVTNLPVHYDPPIKDPSQLRPVRQEKQDGPGLVPCWVQQEPAHKLVNMQGIPVLNVSGQASYHRPYSHCTAKWLNQAGVKTTYVN